MKPSLELWNLNESLFASVSEDDMALGGFVKPVYEAIPGDWIVAAQLARYQRNRLRATLLDVQTEVQRLTLEYASRAC